MSNTGTVIVTGAAGGLGGAIAEKVLQRPEISHYFFTVRSTRSANSKPLLNLIAPQSSNKKTTTLELDLSKLSSVRAFARDINAQVASGRTPPIKALILNAAVFSMGGGSLGSAPPNPDGSKFEMHFAVNYLANFLLSVLLLESMDKECGRIVYISSWTHDPLYSRNASHSPEKLKWDIDELAFAKTPSTAGDEANDAMRRYGKSKLAQITYMNYLRKRLDNTPGLGKISIVGVDPGAMVHSNIVKNPGLLMRHIVIPAFGFYSSLAVKISPNGMFRTTTKSAADVVRGAFDTDKSVTNAYFNGDQLSEPAAESRDQARQEDLWRRTLDLVGLDEKQTVLVK
ncbi:putative short-chain dehydrogenase [Phlyctema vagabunda]|uniref:Short-chain dehydrogenase n=1 Tax=Phlyctema vagabunda TaxID=108571 RepID=A0ABR4P328_9HELO